MLQKFRGMKDQCFGTTAGSGGQERSNEAAALTPALKERVLWVKHRGWQNLTRSQQ